MYVIFGKLQKCTLYYLLICVIASSILKLFFKILFIAKKGAV